MQRREEKGVSSEAALQLQGEGEREEGGEGEGEEGRGERAELKMQ